MLSPIDEQPHVDYLDKAAHLHIPRLGEVDGAVARHEVACRGIEFNPPQPPCANAATAPNNAFAGNAIDTAAPDPPLYYVTTGIVAEAVQAVLHLGSVVTAARLLGFAWLAAAIILLWLAMAELEVGVAARTAVSTLLVTTPAVILSSATVTSDATLLVGGAAALYAVLRWERRKLPGWVVVLIAVLCGFSKVPCLLAIAALSAYLLIRWVRTRNATEVSIRTPSELLKMAVLAPAAGLAVAEVWNLIVRARAIPGVPTSTFNGLFPHHLSLSQLLAQTTATLSPVQNPAILSPLTGARTVAIVAIFNLLIIAAALGGTAASAAGSHLEAIAGSASILMVAAGILFILFVYFDSHLAIDVPPRYGLSLLAFAAVALAAVLTKASVRFGVCAFAIAAALSTVVHLAQYHAA
jgi:hypothetical protein